MVGRLHTFTLWLFFLLGLASDSVTPLCMCMYVCVGMVGCVLAFSWLSLPFRISIVGHLLLYIYTFNSPQYKIAETCFFSVRLAFVKGSDSYEYLSLKPWT
jgi:hypothetical protein